MTGPTTPTRLPGEPIPPPPQPRYPWRVGVTMVGLVVLILVVVWLAFQALKGPPTAGEFPSAPTATAYASAFQATVAAADTAEPRPTRQLTPQAVAQPTTVASTSAPTALPASAAAPAATPRVATTVPASAAQPATTAAAASGLPTPEPSQASVEPGARQVEPARTATVAASGSGQSADVTPASAVAAEIEAQVSAAYARYWQVLADADYSNDPSALDQVAAGEQLATLRNNIAEDQSLGRATRVRVQHSFVVASAHDGRAEVDDRLQDFSVYVDPSTHDPLPGEVEPTSVDTAPTFDATFQLELLDGTWKVISAARVGGG